EQLAICGRSECPKLVQQDCTGWMSEVLGALPTVVPAAKDRVGRDIVSATVSIDGKVAADALDGKPIAVDPGVHWFRFETKGAPGVEEQVVVRPGEKNRIVTATFATDAPALRSDARNGGRSSPPIAAFIAGGVGIAALAVALYVDLDAVSDARTLRET